MSRKPGIIEGLEGAWKDLATTFKHLFGDIKINDYFLTIEIEVKEGVKFEAITNSIRTDINLPKLNSLDDRIINKETITICFSKLVFEIFSLPLVFSKSLNTLETKLSTNIKQVGFINRELKTREIGVGRVFLTKRRNLLIDSIKGKIYSDYQFIGNSPIKARRRSFQEFTPKEIVSFWKLLIVQAKIPGENLELVGIFEPVPLNRVKNLQFNPQDGNINFFIDPQKAHSNQNPVRLVVGRDKNEGRIFTVVIPLQIN